MRKLDYKPTKKELWDTLQGIFKSNPNIESMDSQEDEKGVHVKLFLKKPKYDFTCVWCGKGCSGNSSVACGAVCSDDCAHNAIMAR